VAAMSEIVIVDAVRSPVGRRNGELSGVHPTDLLSHVQRAVVERSGVNPADIGQIVGGCVSQVGEQTFNIARSAWLSNGYPLQVAATTVDAQCGSSQQATNLAYGLVAGGVVDSAIGCGVETMTRTPLGSAFQRGKRPSTSRYTDHFQHTSQFEAAERMADLWGITRQDCDDFGLRSQTLGARAWAEDRFATQITPIQAPVLDNDGVPTGETVTVTRDGGLRETTLDKLAQLKPVGRENGVHTAGSASQISDGAAAVLMMTAHRAQELGLTPLARIVDTCLVGSDPELMLTGPIEATRHLFARTGLSMSDIGVTEINEAFASVVLAWARELEPDMDTVNPNGGAIALGHPLGGTGAILLTKAVHELHRSDKQFGLITMCCGGGLGTGTIVERL
jgi:acetyl-CoA C-acetyltransferase